ncbi:MAG: lysophospholipid acyltransferase family protein [Myxococcales bacterium]|nr:lysophospholipid acyltransferase family protein [Myxococcales bacterium]
MIVARKHRWFNRWFAGHARARLAATFSAVRIAGLEHLRRASAEGPLVIISNHTAWWDPLVALYLANHVIEGDWYAMMNARNLTRLPFFALVGAFGVDLDDPADGARAMRYAVKCLNAPKRAVWIFPQGAERCPTERPLAFRGGSAEVARLARAQTVPVALRYEFRHAEHPELLIDIGPCLAPERDVAAARARHEAAVTAGLDRIDAALCADALAAYEPVLRRPPDRVGAFFERLLSRLTARRALGPG